jgi:hypothetical protein
MRVFTVATGRLRISAQSSTEFSWKYTRLRISRSSAESFIKAARISSPRFFFCKVISGQRRDRLSSSQLPPRCPDDTAAVPGHGVARSDGKTTTDKRACDQKKTYNNQAARHFFSLAHCILRSELTARRANRSDRLFLHHADLFAQVRAVQLQQIEGVEECLRQASTSASFSKTDSATLRRSPISNQDNWGPAESSGLLG